MTFWPWQKALFCIISLDLVLEKEGLYKYKEVFKNNNTTNMDIILKYIQI